MRHGDQHATVMPMLPRADVKAAFGGGENVGFSADITYQGGPILLKLNEMEIASFAKLVERSRFALFLKMSVSGLH